MAILVYNPEFITYWQGHSFSLAAPAEYTVEKNQAGTDLSLVTIEDAFNVIGTLDFLVDGTSIGQVNTVSGLDAVIGKEHPILFDDTLTITGDLTINASFKSNGNTYTSLIINNNAGTISYSDGSTVTTAYTANPEAGAANWTNESFRYITPQNAITSNKFGVLITNHYGEYCGYCLPIDVSSLSGWGSVQSGFRKLQVKYKEASDTKYLVIIKDEAERYDDIASAIQRLFSGAFQEFRNGIGYKVISGINVAIDITNVSAEDLSYVKQQLSIVGCSYKEYDHPKAKISQEVRIGKGTVFSPGQLYGPFEVSDVVDGDTLKIDFGSGVIQKVRLIGVDTPESVATGTMAAKNCLEGRIASEHTKQLISHSIYLEFDTELYDQFNRYLVYLHEDNTGNNMYNKTLASIGYAQAKYYAPNYAHRSELEDAMRSAAESHKGFWGDDYSEESSYFFPTKLPEVTELTINDGILSWALDKYAQHIGSYKIHVVSREESAIVTKPASGATASYDLYDLGLPVGATYSIKVRAIADKKHHDDSNLSDAVSFTPQDYASVPFHVTSDEAYTVKIVTKGTCSAAPEYSTDNTNWQSMTKDQEYSFTANQKCYIRNVTTNTWSELRQYNADKTLTISGSFKTAAGNLNRLINQSTTLPDFCFYVLFGGSTKPCPNLQNVGKLVIPWDTVGKESFRSAFYNCTSLTSCPKLPATTLANMCYYQMFRGCTSLTTIPKLQATTLADSCYYCMFQQCTGLTRLPDDYVLPADTLAPICYSSMFDGSGLTTIPSGLLPATTLAERCYEYMFRGCYSLTNIPVDLLQATTMAVSCYDGMFTNCRALRNCLELPGTTLAKRCYSSMFSSCYSLTQLPKLAVTTLEQYCYSYMFSGCSNIRLSTAQGGIYQTPYRVPFEGEGTIATSALTGMFAQTGGTFVGEPTINTTYYTSNTIVE